MEFIKRNKVILIVAALIVLFVASIALTPTPTEYLNDDATVAEWLAVTNEDKYSIVTLAQTTCGHCVSFKPNVQKFAEVYDVDWYWFEVNLMGEEDYVKLTEMFDDFEGTPYTAIIKKGEIKGKIGGAVEYSGISKYLEDAGMTLVKREITEE